MIRSKAFIAAILVGGAAIVVGCGRQTSSSDAGSATTVSAPPRSDPDAEGRDVLVSLRETYPLACFTHAADWDWATCHDETKGFQALLNCAEASLKKARAAKEGYPKFKASSICGRSIVNATKVVVDATPPFFEDLISWLKASRAKIEPGLRTKPLADVCSAVDCSGKPSAGSEKYQLVDFAVVNRVECTRKLLACGVARKPCHIGEVAARLGLACDPTENRWQDPVFVQETGLKLPTGQ